VFSRHKNIIGLAILLALIEAGCGAPRAVKYYTLDTTPAPVTSTSAQFPISLLVGRVMSSQLYRDDRIVYGSGQVQLGLYDYDRWSEPPTDLIQTALIASLRATGQYRSISRVTSSVKGDYILRSRLISMYGVDLPVLSSRLVLQLELYDPVNHAVVWSQAYSHDEPVQGDKTVANIVIAMDANVKTCLQQTTASLSQYFTANPPKPASAD
jgi:ABC-type uncharacterized transport system auxiliary subunit